MKLAKLQYITSIHKNQLYVYTQVVNNLKIKLFTYNHLYVMKKRQNDFQVPKGVDKWWQWKKFEIASLLTSKLSPQYTPPLSHLWGQRFLKLNLLGVTLVDKIIKIWTSSWICMSFLHRGCVNLLYIGPVLVSMLPKRALRTEDFFPFHLPLYLEQCLVHGGGDG